MAKPKTNPDSSEFTKESEWWFAEAKSFLKRVPFASLLAWCMCVGGIVIFSVCLYKALEFLVQQFDIGIISKIVWLIMIFHIAMASFWLFMGILSTGGTRKEVCTSCVAVNIAGRCFQWMMMAAAYLFHFIWLILPTALLMPVVLLTVFAILCHILPDCITLSDYGIPPEMVDQVNPDDIINTIRSINSSDIEGYIDQAEDVIQGAIESAENSPILEDILSKIENNIPSEEEIHRFVSMVTENIDTEQVIGVIDQIQAGVDKGAEKIGQVIDTVADRAKNINLTDALVENIDNLQDHVGTIGDHVEGLTGQLDEHLDSAEDAVDEALDNVANQTLPEFPSDYEDKLANRTVDIPDGATDNFVDTAIPSGAIDDLANTSVAIPESGESRSISKRQTDATAPEGLEDAKEKVDGELKEMQEGARQNLDNLKEDVQNYTREAQDKATKELDALRDQTEEQVADLKNRATDMMNNASGEFDKTREELAATAEGLKESAKETADAIKEQATKTAEELKQEAERTADEIKDKANEVARDLEEQGRQIAEDVQETIEQEKERLRQGLEGVKDLGNKTLEELRELASQGKEQLENIKDRAQEIGQDLKEQGQKTVEEFVDSARQIAEEAQMVANVAAQEAEKALQKALEASKNVALQVDKSAKELAVQAEAKAREAANKAQQAATDALEKAKEAIRNADELADAVASGAADLIREAAMNVRQYARQAIEFAKHATAEAAKGARQAAKMYDTVKEEVLKGYDMFMMMADQLGIERKQGSDTFCSEAKVMYCAEITKSHICMILVFLSSIILNLSMVHFLMAMAANYVHLKREWKAAKVQKETENQLALLASAPLTTVDDTDDLPPTAKDQELPMLNLELSDTGSFVTRI